ncbi:DUF3105 domain-containing protein [Deinococcus sp. KNUC1210]|uniref:DUF3105 domain-containing protein n=1 Tax=Deinococcus sp. KNUC1210 TaxID=2917691 RepID=UPI001EF0D9A9|nr:DUF3105 domain-containing protein [Deinococcus sp. KNUC1210]ULH14485.1 DUF3105 domain-containing protein [Deinococcus sp. KNUC1210]
MSRFRFLYFLLPAVFLAACRPGIEHLTTYHYAGGQMQEGKLQYSENPPVGGVYSPVWQSCGVYAAPVYDEYAVHTLARGAIWITYAPALPAAEVNTLKALLRAQPLSLLSPRSGLPSPVVITAWNAQLQATGADDARLSAFVKQFSDIKTAPEYGAACAGGSTDTQ